MTDEDRREMTPAQRQHTLALAGAIGSMGLVVAGMMQGSTSVASKAWVATVDFLAKSLWAVICDAVELSGGERGRQ